MTRQVVLFTFPRIEKDINGIYLYAGILKNFEGSCVAYLGHKKVGEFSDVASAAVSLNNERSDVLLDVSNEAWSKRVIAESNWDDDAKKPWWN